MHKQQSVRVQTGAEGGLEVVIALSPDTITATEDTACRLGITAEEALVDFFTRINESAESNLPDNLLTSWVFPTEERAREYHAREGLGDYYGVYPVEDGGFMVEHCALREMGRRLDAVSAGDRL
jgi:hypothetical protein